MDCQSTLLCNPKQTVHNPKSKIEMISSRLTFISLLTLLAFVLAPAALDAKRKKRSQPPPLKIVDITASPVPFAPGREPMTITVTVELPKKLDQFDLLEVSSLISLSTRRSIRFLVRRQLLNAVVIGNGKSRMTVALLWDGRDQTRQYVPQGTYSYEAKAKLMAHEDGFTKAKIVSPYARGTLDVFSPQTRAREAPHLEHVPFVSDETGSDPLNEEGEDPGTSDSDQP